MDEISSSMQEKDFASVKPAKELLDNPDFVFLHWVSWNWEALSDSKNLFLCCFSLRWKRGVFLHQFLDQKMGTKCRFSTCLVGFVSCKNLCDFHQFVHLLFLTSLQSFFLLFIPQYITCLLLFRFTQVLISWMNVEWLHNVFFFCCCTEEFIFVKSL